MLGWTAPVACTGGSLHVYATTYRTKDLTEGIEQLEVFMGKV